MLHIFPFPTDIFVQCYHLCFSDCGLVCLCSLGCFSMISEISLSPKAKVQTFAQAAVSHRVLLLGAVLDCCSPRQWLGMGGRAGQIPLSFPRGCCASPKTAFQLSKTAADPHCRIICSCLRAVHLFRACKHCQQGFDRSEK